MTLLRGVPEVLPATLDHETDEVAAVGLVLSDLVQCLPALARPG